jgi:cytoskeletal protein CcmA (bactofilin family)
MASIGKSLHVKGELSGSEDLVIDGQVEGRITLNGYHVTIGTTGRVAAEIVAKSVVVRGQVKGNITADERVEIAATGTMVGDLRAPRVVLVDGARFKGCVDMESKSAPRASFVAPAAGVVSGGVPGGTTGGPTGDAPNSRDTVPAFAAATKL